MSAGTVTVTPRRPAVGDLDPRLLAARGRLLAEIALEHDFPWGAQRCPSCGWAITPETSGTVSRVCPSRVLARCVREHRPVPSWLAHLASAVPGALTYATRGPR